MGESLLERHVVGVEVAEPVDPCEDLGGVEHERVRVVVGCGRARNEYTHTVVLCRSF